MELKKISNYKIVIFEDNNLIKHSSVFVRPLT